MNRNKTRPKLLFATGVLLVNIVQAQESANSSGGNASGSEGTVSYSIGQLVYTTNTGSSGSVEQGIQNAYEILNFGSKETDLNISLFAYPNPATDIITLEIKDYKNEKLDPARNVIPQREV